MDRIVDRISRTWRVSRTFLTVFLLALTMTCVYADDFALELNDSRLLASDALLTASISADDLHKIKPGDRLLLAKEDPAYQDTYETTTDPLVIMQDDQMPRRSGVSKTSARLATVGLVLIPLDRMLVRNFPRTSDGERPDGFTRVFNELGDGEVLLASIGCLYLLGNSDDKRTAELALSALVNAAVTTETLKMLAGRERPYAANGGADFHGPRTGSNEYKSFPSGHTAVAFAVATVLADRNPEQRSLYYGIASAVGLSRVRVNAHFPSDVLVGAAVGIHSGRNTLMDGPRLFSIRF